MKKGQSVRGGRLSPRVLVPNGIRLDLGDDTTPVAIKGGRDLTATPGSITVITGESGVGKSSLAEAARSAIGEGAIVYQQGNLLEYLSPQEHFWLAASARRDETVEVQRDIREVTEILGLSERTSHSVANLSGGERRRVAVARALIARPAILWMDEPDTGLDPRRSDGMADYLAEWTTATGAVVVLVSHSSRFVARLAAAKTHVQIYCLRLRKGRHPAESTNGHSNWLTLDRLRYSQDSAVEKALERNDRQVQPAEEYHLPRVSPGRAMPRRSAISAREAYRFFAGVVGSLPTLAEAIIFRKEQPRNVSPRVASVHQALLRVTRSRAGMGGAGFCGLASILFAGMTLLPLRGLDVAPMFGGGLLERIMYPPFAVTSFAVLSGVLFSATGASMITSWMGQMSVDRELDALASLGADLHSNILGPIWTTVVVGYVGAAILSLVTIALSCTAYIGMVLGSPNNAQGAAMAIVGQLGVGTSVLRSAQIVIEVGSYAVLVATIAVMAGTDRRTRKQEDVTRAVADCVVWCTVALFVVKVVIEL